MIAAAALSSCQGRTASTPRVAPPANATAMCDATRVTRIEGVFSIFKRGMKGIYQHCQEKHLHRYMAEFDFRYTHRSANGVDGWQISMFISAHSCM